METSLASARLYGSKFYGFDLRGAELRGGFTSASFNSAKLWWANLKGSNLIEATGLTADLRRLWDSEFGLEAVMGRILIQPRRPLTLDVTGLRKRCEAPLAQVRVD